MSIDILIWPFAGLALIGILYTLAAAILVHRFGRMPATAADGDTAITLLKPLYGAEPRLVDNLATFLDQAWSGPVQMVLGVAQPNDPAAAAARRLAADRPAADIRLVVDPARHGANAKIGNLINMAPAAAHDILILSDSDMAVPADYLAQVTAALAAPGVGAVTCLYRGRGDAGFWSVLAAAGLSYQFLPSVIVSLALGTGDVCMGSTIALQRAVLDRVGGFAPLADVLADDHALGAAVRKLGLTIAVPPLVLDHGSTDASLAALLRHEGRWAVTVRALNPAGYVGMIATYPLPFALAAALLAPAAGGVLVAAALLARWLLVRAVDRLCHARTAPFWLLPARDLLSLGVFVGAFFMRSVDWRGARLRIGGHGRVSAGAES